MSPKDWEQEIKEAYCDYRWRQIMEPLCDVFQKWKAGEIGHEQVDEAIDEAYKEKITVNSLMAQRQDRAAGLIRCWDPEWFRSWVDEHQAPLQIDTEPC
ncbi:MAG: hypothetical protein PVF47_04480 [Anaerolineae bacterium]|jgi:hypothetical protein